MQRLKSVFQISMTVLVCLSATIFSAAEEQPLVSLTVPAAIVAWAAVDRRDRPGVGPGWSFAWGLFGVGAAVMEFVTGGIEARILAPSHLLAYLMWIVLFQHKENRHYWILLGLTVLQVAIASLLTSAAWLGVAVILYASCALWTMGVFTLHRAVQRVSTGGPGVGDALYAPAAPLSSGARDRRGGFSTAQSSTVQNSVHLDPAERLIGWHFTGGALVMTVLALALSGLFFLFIPRIWPNQYRLFHDAPIVGARPLTGFTEDVKLGDMGEILENDELVMEITLFENDTDAAIEPARYAEELGSDDPLFRGQVMEYYDSARWQRTNPDESLRTAAPWGRGRPPLEQKTLRQHILLQPIGTAMLFGAGRVVRCQPTTGEERFTLETHTGTFRRHEDADLTRVIEYDAFSSRLGPSYIGIERQYRELCLRLPRGVERLLEITREIAPHDSQAPAAQRAERLVQYLRDNPDFSYSLDLSVQDPQIDPVIDFLFNRKRGHCEYYASALALLLRASRIPSRVVSGFKGGQFNAETGKYEVRQLHAHLWVEAFIDSRWVSLDATPAARDASVAELQLGSESVLGRMRSVWEHTWSQGVRLSRADQDRLLYEPIREGAVELWDAVRDLRGTSSRLGRFLRGLATSPERWISWRGGVAVFVLLLVGSAVTALLRRVWRLLRRISGATIESRRTAPSVAFYERFRRVAARAGYERGGAQTPREFACSVSDRLGARTATLRSPEIPQIVTESYYRVRFGDESLPAELLQTLQLQLDELERQLGGHVSAAPGGAR